MPENKLQNHAELINWPALLQRFNGREAFIYKLIAKALDETHQDFVPKLHLAVTEQDNATIKFIAHNLKSLAGFFEAQVLFEIAQETDHAAQNQQENAYLLATKLAETMQNFLEELKQKQSNCKH